MPGAWRAATPRGSQATMDLLGRGSGVHALCGRSAWSKRQWGETAGIYFPVFVTSPDKRRGILRLSDRKTRSAIQRIPRRLFALMPYTRKKIPAVSPHCRLDRAGLPHRAWTPDPCPSKSIVAWLPLGAAALRVPVVETPRK